MYFHYKKKQKQKNKTKRKRKKKKSAKICLCLISYSIDFLLLGSSLGLSEIFMRDELRESSLRSFVPWIMTDMYLI